MKVLIVEDESPAANKLKQMLLRYSNEMEVVANLSSVQETVAWLSSHPAPDLIMMDIQIDDGLCFEIFKEVKVLSPVIFTTAYDQYAIRAFEVHSIDYLLKPFSYEKLEISLNKLMDIQQNRQELKSSPVNIDQLMEALEGQKQRFKSRFLVKAGTKIRSVKSSEIAYIYTDRKLNLLVTGEGDRYPVDQSLDELSQLLDPQDFFRANRQLIIHIDAVKVIHPYFKGRVKLEITPSLDQEIIISSERTPSFKAWLDQ